MQEKIIEVLKKSVKNLNILVKDINLEHPADFKKGDYSTNLAIVNAKNLKTTPKILAEKIVQEINTNIKQMWQDNNLIEKVEATGNGFINFYLSKKFFTQELIRILKEQEKYSRNDFLAGKKIMIEYTNPNPFKPFHIGHLMTNAIGESIARILETSGAKVYRANYQGDVGLHVAKAIWGILNSKKWGHISYEDEMDNHADNLDSQTHPMTPSFLLPLTKGEEGWGSAENMVSSPTSRPQTNQLSQTHHLQKKNVSALARWIGECYSKGSNAYENEEIKKEIDEINKKVYEKSDEKINKIYDWGFEITMKAFEDIYETLGTEFDFYFLESQTTPVGKKIVEQNIGNIFEESDGAIVFKAEKYDPSLNTRVFITSANLPTYEAKELGLASIKNETTRDLDSSIVVTANEQDNYFKIIEKVVSLLWPNYAGKIKHIVHGMMRFKEGKMSSRTRNIITGESLLNDTKDLILEKISTKNGPIATCSEAEKEKIAYQISVAAIKYSILKQNIASDIIYDIENSISVNGNSGPYLQYSYARARSVMKKSSSQTENLIEYLSTHEKAGLSNYFEFIPGDLEKLLYRLPEVVMKAAEELRPHYIVTYLIVLTQAFNAFYNDTQIIDEKDPFSPYKIAMTEAFSIVLKNGLNLLGISTPENI